MMHPVLLNFNSEFQYRLTCTGGYIFKVKMPLENVTIQDLFLNYEISARGGVRLVDDDDRIGYSQIRPETIPLSQIGGAVGQLSSNYTNKKYVQ